MGMEELKKEDEVLKLKRSRGRSKHKLPTIWHHPLRCVSVCMLMVRVMVRVMVRAHIVSRSQTLTRKAGESLVTLAH